MMDMSIQQRAVIIIGGGPAGLACAVQLKKKGVSDILILEREKELGGILRQCIHDGFGLTRFREALSGPEYALRFMEQVSEQGIEVITDITVTELSQDLTVTAIDRSGYHRYRAEAVVLAMGCRERTRGAIRIAGTRPAGIYTAGVAQAYINLKNIMVGQNAVILGSGDIGLIMARRLALEGVKVHGVFEINRYPSGLPRNIMQCLDDFAIPLYLGHTVTNVHGDRRLTGVTTSRVDSAFAPVAGTEQFWPCDTLIVSVGLIPENELSKMAGVQLDQRTNGPLVDDQYRTSVKGIYAAGNVLHVHDLVDFVSLEAETMAESVAEYLSSNSSTSINQIPLIADDNLLYVLPQSVSGERDFSVSCRVVRPLAEATITVWQKDKQITRRHLKQANPAEMIHLKIRHDRLCLGEPLKVVVSHA